jgi:hypothetical protein
MKVHDRMPVILHLPAQDWRANDYQPPFRFNWND